MVYGNNFWKVWKFNKNTTIEKVLKRLRELSIEPNFYSVTASYYYSGDPVKEIVIFESLTDYGSYGESSDNFNPELLNRFFRRRKFNIDNNDPNERLIELASDELSSEAEFYEKIMYSKPDNVVNLQQLIFTHDNCNYAMEINFESGVAILRAAGSEKPKAKKIFKDFLEKTISNEDYLKSMLFLEV